MPAPLRGNGETETPDQSGTIAGAGVEGTTAAFTLKGDEISVINITEESNAVIIRTNSLLCFMT
jgi:hypothetical protein